MSFGASGLAGAQDDESAGIESGFEYLLKTQAFVVEFNAFRRSVGGDMNDRIVLDLSEERAGSCIPADEQRTLWELRA